MYTVGELYTKRKERQQTQRNKLIDKETTKTHAKKKTNKPRKKQRKHSLRNKLINKETKKTHANK